MPTSEEIEQEFKELGIPDNAITQKAIEYLPKILAQSENLNRLALGNVGLEVGLLVLTRRRVLFLAKDLSGGVSHMKFSLEDITSVEHKIGAAFGKITIEHGDETTTFKNVPKKMIEPFITAVNEAISSLDS